MSHRVLIIGAGMGGLTAAIRLALAGVDVEVIEARSSGGGLASRIEEQGFKFDAGPYILLDRPGLEWAFTCLGTNLNELVSLRKIEDVYRVSLENGPAITFYSSLDRTAEEFEDRWPGTSSKYKQFVATMRATHERLSPLLYISSPGLADLFRSGAIGSAAFLLRSLGQVLSRSGLPSEVVEAIAIWTQVAGQKIAEAPSPMAFVPALIHTVGAFYPKGGVGAIPEALINLAHKCGVSFRFSTKVKTIVTSAHRVLGVTTAAGELIKADSIVSNYNGVGTYLDLLTDETPQRQKFQRLPLQSPGACVYLICRGKPQAPYLKFSTAKERSCRLFVTPSVMEPELMRDGWYPARLIAPMNYELAQSLSLEQQRAFVDEMFSEKWWQEGVEEFRVLSTRVPAEWGIQFNLYRDSMNPVMTSRFMRAGRIPHKSAYLDGLYLTGSSTHPGQWVSFCAISGIHAANALLKDHE